MFNLQERLQSFAMLGAGWVMWLLVGLSVIAVAVILERIYFLMAARDDIEVLKRTLLAKLKDNDLDGARKVFAASKAIEAEVIVAGLDGAKDGAASAEERMAGQATLTKLTMERNLAFLGTVGNNAPFVGLLGTVIGIIRAFQELDRSQGQVSTRLMAEIGEALVATAIGLLVALPAVAAYNYFQRLIKGRITRAEALGKNILAYLKSEPAPTFKKKPETAETASA